MPGANVVRRDGLGAQRSLDPNLSRIVGTRTGHQRSNLNVPSQKKSNRVKCAWRRSIGRNDG